MFDQNESALCLIFEDQTGRRVDFDLRGSGPGRPKLGVISRKITLLPRQWDWLEQQPNGAWGNLSGYEESIRSAKPA